MGNTAWITGRATTMRALTTLAQFSLLAFSCQALKITDNCSSGAQCSQELNGFRGAESVQNCQGAQCDIDFGRQPSQGRPQNNQQGFNRDRPNNDQPGRVTITDNCSSGAQCSQNLNGNVVDSTQNCRGAQCDVNFGGSRGSGGNGGAVAGNNGFGGGGNRGVAGNNGFGAGGNRGVAGNNGFGGGGTGGVTVNRECVGNRCTVNTNGAGNNGFGGAANNGGFGGGNSGIGGGATGRIETVNCGQGVRTASTSVNGVIQVTCLNGNTKTANCPPGGQSVRSNDGYKVTIQCNGGAAFGGNQRRRGGGNERRRGGGGGGVTINRTCSGSQCSVSTINVGRQG